MSINDSKSGPWGTRTNSNIMNASDVAIINSFQTRAMTGNHNVNSKSKCLTDMLRFNDKEQQWFADRIEALREYEK